MSPLRPSGFSSLPLCKGKLDVFLDFEEMVHLEVCNFDLTDQPSGASFILSAYVFVDSFGYE